ncbi:DUF5316 family protein [Fictibacillus aquaticus]|uniref:Uncharacterized protein n=1 Tax=Fictibacillus aquaticus TaxID=2021314 RepID=A0A235F8E1_9BACL|nr:DUF5316 family protein [Fictibacillus aquaticus]OYD57247.1 hypothetical protein CGZ90_11195 [Fictibacillus aquaticus]
MLRFFVIAGVVAILVSGTFIGLWTNGEQQRANYHSETADHRAFRTKMGMYSGLVGFLSFGAAGLIWYLT